jgi:hypothetical protein
MTYLVRGNKGTPFAHGTCTDPSGPPLSVVALSPAGERRVAHINALMEEFPGTATEVLLSRFGPYASVELLDGPAS